jgi:hypothetical protein
MRGLEFNKSDPDDTDEFAGGEVENQISKAIIALPNEHTTRCF